MAFTTKVITDTSPDFGDNPQTITESGKPASVEVDNLIPNTAHWTKSEIWQDGVLNDTSNVETFTTLPAGTITLEYIQTTRSGYGYDVTYRYTSTYAPSSAILSTNGTQFQGFINSEQHTVSFWVTGLTAGTAYLTNVTLYDIYAESVTVMGSIVTTVVNEVRITDTTPSETSVECELDYVIDDGFTVGYVEYWLSSQDPATEQAQGHFYFNNGDTSVVAGGLTAGTAYLFRATILLGDGTTEIHSSVVSESTVEDNLTKYLTITNTSNTSGNVGVYRVSGNTGSPYNLYYTLDGNTWTNHYNWEAYQTINVPAGGSVSFKGNFSDGLCNENNTFRFGGNLASCTLSGNPFSLRNTNPNTFSTYTSALPYEFKSIFSALNVTDASGLATSQITSVGDYAFQDTFNKYGSPLAAAPDFSGVTTVGDYGFYRTFYYLSNLATPSNFGNVRTVGNHGFENAFTGTGLRETPNFSNVTSVGDYGFSSTFMACSSLAKINGFDLVTSAGKYGFNNTFSGTAITETPYFNSLSTINAYTFSAAFDRCTNLTRINAFRRVSSVGDHGLNYTFRGCTALAEADFSGITSANLQGIYGTFEGATSLNKVYAPNVSAWDTNVFYNWLRNVASTGVIHKPRNLTIPTDTTSGVPTGWTTQDY